MAMAMRLVAGCSVTPTAHSNDFFRTTLRSSTPLLRFSSHRPQRLFSFVTAASADDASSTDPAPKPTPASSKKPGFSMSKGQIVRVDKDKYLESVEYYAVGHPKFFKGLDYIYEDRGEILDLRNFEAGEYALVTWAGIPTSPAWLPTYMLIKSDKLSYKRA